MQLNAAVVPPECPDVAHCMLRDASCRPHASRLQLHALHVCRLQHRRLHRFAAISAAHRLQLRGAGRCRTELRVLALGEAPAHVERLDRRRAGRERRSVERQRQELPGGSKHAQTNKQTHALHHIRVREYYGGQTAESAAQRTLAALSRAAGRKQAHTHTHTHADRTARSARHRRRPRREAARKLPTDH